MFLKVHCIFISVHSVRKRRERVEDNGLGSFPLGKKILGPSFRVVHYRLKILVLPTLLKEISLGGGVDTDTGE